MNWSAPTFHVSIYCFVLIQPWETVCSLYMHWVVSAQSFSCVLYALFSRSAVSDSATAWNAAHQASLSFTISQSLLKFMSIESVLPSNHFILCSPLPLLPVIFPSIRVFCNGLTLCIRESKYWSFSFSISPSNEYSGIISFKIDWFV